MGMATIQFYRNRYHYPHYSNSITPYGQSMPCTPVGINLRAGTLRVKGDMEDFMSCNYLSFTRDSQTLYAWIDDVKFLTEDSFEVTYSVDAWRTYRSKIDLGVQYIARSPIVTYKYDNLLGSTTTEPEVISTMQSIGNPNRRVLVVQVRPDVGVPFSRTPVQPSPYLFYLTDYEVNNWLSNPAIDVLLSTLAGGAQTQNIVTMYSIPYVPINVLPDVDLYVKVPGDTVTIPGFKLIDHLTDPRSILYNEETLFFSGVNRNELMRVDHTVQVVIPEAGIINVPDEILMNSTIKLRQDIDLYSGASNYMLKTGSGTYYAQSVRGSSVSSIPILSDPEDTYISQNQNQLTTSILTDVASVVGGTAVAASSGGIGAIAGAGAITSGIRSMASRYASIKDAGSRYSNPPAFLGSALATSFNGRFWTVVTRAGVENAAQVHSNFGYAYDMVDELTFPSYGFIQTEGCSVTSTDGSVPRWAIEEINNIFNNGIFVHG